MANITQLKQIASQTRRDIVRMVHGAQSGHPGGSLGCTDYLVALFHHAMQYRPQPFDMSGSQEDIFFLSNGHISPLYYSVLARAGYFDIKELATFRQINSRLQGHPTTHEHLPGVRIATGSLGQGLSVAVGAAVAKKMNGDPQKVYALCGDGEIQEGQIWEAAMFAAAKKVDNLIVAIDANGQQIDGATNEVLPLGNIGKKFEAFGWQVLKLPEGNNMEMVVDVIGQAQQLCGQSKPVVIVMTTEMGAGVDFMMGSHKWHGIAPNNEQLASALQQLTETVGDY